MFYYLNNCYYLATRIILYRKRNGVKENLSVVGAVPTYRAGTGRRGTAKAGKIGGAQEFSLRTPGRYYNYLDKP